jgi:uncharacterized membrane protein
MVFNATFSNISVISLMSVLMVEENGVPRENHQPVGQNVEENILRLALFVLSFVVILNSTSGALVAQ